MVEVHRVFRTARLYNGTIFRDCAFYIFADLARKDYFYNDSQFQKHSLVRLDGYLLWSENITKRYPGYMLTQEGTILPTTEITVNLDDLLALLRSKEIEKYERERDTFFGKTSRYTTGNSKEQMAVLYSTFPRSGNSMMRKYYENVTGIVTGTDLGTTHMPNLALQYTGLKGEGIDDSRCWIKKSHFPLTIPF